MLTLEEERGISYRKGIQVLKGKNELIYHFPPFSTYSLSALLYFDTIYETRGKKLSSIYSTWYLSSTETHLFLHLFSAILSVNQYTPKECD